MAENVADALTTTQKISTLILNAPVEDLHKETGVADTGDLQRALHALEHAVAVAVAFAAVGILGRPEEHAAHADQAALVGLLQQLVAVLSHLRIVYDKKRREKQGGQRTLRSEEFLQQSVPWNSTELNKLLKLNRHKGKIPCE